jgi:hypothetical protein
MMDDLLQAYGIESEDEDVSLPAGGESLSLESLLSKYAKNEYLEQAREAKRKRDELLQARKGSMAGAAQIKSGAPSQAERYFRLAQAFLDPGKSGALYETMGNVSRVSAELAKEEREAQEAQQKAALEAAAGIQELDIEAAGEEAEMYRELAKESESTRGDIAKELAKASIKPRGAQSPAGKQAMDEGLKPGTPEFHQRVAEIARASGDAVEARLNVALANAALAEARFERGQAEFTPFEQKTLEAEEDALFSREEAVGLLNEALNLNDLAYSSSPADVIAYNTAVLATPDSPKVVATNELNNILKSQMLTVLKSTFGAAPTEGERAILAEVQGIESKSKTERKRIIQRAIRLAEARIERSRRKIEEIQSGKLRFRSGPSTPTEEPAE